MLICNVRNTKRTYRVSIGGILMKYQSTNYIKCRECGGIMERYFINQPHHLEAGFHCVKCPAKELDSEFVLMSDADRENALQSQDDRAISK